MPESYSCVARQRSHMSEKRISSHIGKINIMFENNISSSRSSRHWHNAFYLVKLGEYLDVLWGLSEIWNPQPDYFALLVTLLQLAGLVYRDLVALHAYLAQRQDRALREGGSARRLSEGRSATTRDHHVDEDQQGR